MKNLFLLAAASIILVSCQQEDCCTIISTDIEISISDGSGIDLLDPNNEGAFLEEDITLYNVIEGDEVPFYQSDLSAPKGFRIQARTDGVYSLTLWLNTPESESIAEGDRQTAFLQFGDDETNRDQIDFTHSNPSGNSVTLDQVWINGDMVWTESDQDTRYFTLTK